MSASDRGERVHTIPNFLKKDDQANAPTTELALQRLQFEQAVAILGGLMAQMPAMLQPVMRAANPTDRHAGEIDVPQPGSTPLGSWLAVQTNIVAGMSRDLANLIHRVDL